MVNVNAWTYFTSFGAQIINSHGTDAIPNKSSRMTVEPKLTATLDIYPTQIPEIPSVTMIRSSVCDDPTLNFQLNYLT